jgi:hypothetical protein
MGSHRPSSRRPVGGAPVLAPILALILLAAALLPGPAAAQPRAGDCVVGPGLGSTVLVPYWEVNLADPFALTTLVSVHNALSTPVVTRVVVWTDWAVPSLAFDVYLTGFDIQTMNLRDLLNGVIPSTGEGVDLSAWPFCGGALRPYHVNPVLTAAQRSQLVAWHSGLGGPLNSDCAGSYDGSNVARGYMTIDVVDECSGVEVEPVFTPANTLYPYFADGGGSGGIAKIANQLWGDILYVDTANAAAQGVEAVSIWADSSLFSGMNVFTFYGRYSNWDGRDDRVPLPYRWDQRFLNGGPFAGGATVTVWRDTGEPPETVTCGVAPIWWPLGATIATMNEDAGGLYSLSSTLLPNATQRQSLDGLGIPYSFGWVQIDTHVAQSWVISTLTAGGLFSAGFQGSPVEFLCNRSPLP